MKIFDKIKLRRAYKNQFESLWLRHYFCHNYNIDVGLYSYGCFDPLRIPKNTRIGRYCSFSNTCYFLNGNHGLSFLSLHPYFYNVNLGVVTEESISRTNFVVEDDVWVGHNAIILPSVKFIGRGSVIGAGAVVAKDVGRYEIVGGNPAKVIRKRFNEETINHIEKTQWWLKNKSEIAEIIISNNKLAFEPQNYFYDEIARSTED